jgi:dTDP-4-dehydrorhamnose 3,5-epimerase
MNDSLEYIEGGIAIDERGQIQFCNNFKMGGIRRFYTISNHQAQFIRAWHGHEKETKYVFVISGAAIIAAVKIDNWEHPDKTAFVHRHILSEKKPGILKIPAGFAHGFKTLTPDTKIMFFSTVTLEESLNDDYRYEFNYWDPWEVKPR